MNERKFRRGLIGLAITAVILTSIAYIFPQSARGATPTISYVSPSDGATFVDVIPGEGVNWTVNVTDSDGNLQRVRLLSNSSGSWQVFYDSGELTGTVYYHNASGINPDWTGSWKTYYWRVACYDGTWTNYTYSFTTEYVFGQPHLISPTNGYDYSGQTVVYKNDTGEYYLWMAGLPSGHIGVRQSSNGQDFAVKTLTDTGISATYVYNAFTYNNIPYVYSIEYDCVSYLTYVWYDGTAWQSGSTGMRQIYAVDKKAYSYGADVIYYDGIYQLVYGYGYRSSNLGRAALRYATSTNPLSSFTYISQFDSYGALTAKRYYMPSLQILGSKLILTYIDAGDDLHWQVYDGAGWTDKGDIEANLGASNGHWQSSVRDIANDQLVCVYINASGWLVYRVLTDPDGTWSDPVVLFKPASGYSIKYPYATYYDRRLVITFQYNIRGNYETFVMFAPEYTEVTSGLSNNLRIQFPDATPNQQHVNSTVFAIKNINDRPILNITWHVGNIGEIETANNVKVWSNMSGSWTNSWTVGADHNTSEIDISAVKGSEWMPGETLYWKLEILDVGAVPETEHIGHDIYYIVDLGT